MNIFKARHNPNEVELIPVTRREIIQTSRGPVPVTPGKDIIVREGLDVWVNTVEDCDRRYGDSLSDDDKEALREYYPEAFK